MARKHGTTVEKVKEIIQETGSRSREQIEAALDKEFQHMRPRKPAKRRRSARGSVVTQRDLAVLARGPRPFSSPDWLFELKFDGYRALAVRGAEVRIGSTDVR